MENNQKIETPIKQNLSNELKLDRELYNNIQTYIDNRGFSFGTKQLYEKILKNLFSLGVLNDTTARKLNKKGTYNKAVLSIIINESKFLGRDFNPRLVKRISPQRKLPKTYTMDELKNIISLIPDREHKLLFQVAFGIGSGLRFAEAINLKFSDFKWFEYYSSNKTKCLVIINKAKRGKSYELPTNSDIFEKVLNFYLQTHQPQKNIIPELGTFEVGIINCNDYIFDFVTENEIDPTGYLKVGNEKEEFAFIRVKLNWQKIRNQIIRKYINPILGYNFKFHSIRHTKATTLLKRGIGIETISTLLGHSSLSTTMIYLNFTSVEKEKALEGFPAI